MPKKKEPPLSDAEQRRRFEALARQVGADTSTRDFRRVVGKVLAKRAAPKEVGRK